MENLWDWIIWIVVGGVVGWVASLIMKTNQSQGPLMNVIVGIVGALLGGWLAGLLFADTATINEGVFNWQSLLVSLIGAIILVGIVGFFTRGRSA
jgi:uncharacterized membrane protein YeaQ/YmgE (transglycosylase-associated protein family)